MTGEEFAVSRRIWPEAELDSQPALQGRQVGCMAILGVLLPSGCGGRPCGIQGQVANHGLSWSGYEFLYLKQKTLQISSH